MKQVLLTKNAQGEGWMVTLLLEGIPSPGEDWSEIKEELMAVIGACDAPVIHYPLTRVQSEVLRLHREGWNTIQISNRLKIGRQTVKNHKHQIGKVLGADWTQKERPRRPGSGQ